MIINLNLDHYFIGSKGWGCGQVGVNKCSACCCQWMMQKLGLHLKKYNTKPTCVSLPILTSNQCDLLKKWAFCTYALTPWTAASLGFLGLFGLLLFLLRLLIFLPFLWAGWPGSGDEEDKISCPVDWLGPVKMGMSVDISKQNPRI